MRSKSPNSSSNEQVINPLVYCFTSCKPVDNPFHGNQFELVIVAQWKKEHTIEENTQKAWSIIYNVQQQL